MASLASAAAVFLPGRRAVAFRTPRTPRATRGPMARRYTKRTAIHLAVAASASNPTDGTPNSDPPASGSGGAPDGGGGLSRSAETQTSAPAPPAAVPGGVSGSEPASNVVGLTGLKAGADTRWYPFQLNCST
jgi:hypothetical protein